MAAAVVVVLGLLVPISPWRMWRAPIRDVPGLVAEVDANRGIGDDASFDYEYTGLLPVINGAQPSEHPFALLGRPLNGRTSVSVFSAVGLTGFYAGPAAHIIDRLALGDPLLSRLPAMATWRIGHFGREIPLGYRETIEHCMAMLFPSGTVAPHVCGRAWPRELDH